MQSVNFLRVISKCLPKVKLKPLFFKKALEPIERTTTESHLDHFTKALERFLHEQTTEFLEKNKTLHKFQSGFRKNHLTNFGFDPRLLT